MIFGSAVVVVKQEPTYAVGSTGPDRRSGEKSPIVKYVSVNDKSVCNYFCKFISLDAGERIINEKYVKHNTRIP